ncbi:MAG: flagellar hook-basal body complex protein FliE [Fimbriimonadaceae bacterium]
MKLQGLGNQTTAPLDKPSVSGSQGDDFATQLMDTMKEVNQAQMDSKELQNQFMAGQPVEFHDLMISMEKAGTAMQLTMQVRNKVLEAYQEMMRMQI